MPKPRKKIQQSEERARTLAERRDAPTLRYYRTSDLVVRYGVSRKTLWTWWATDVVAPRMPAPIAIGPATKVWPVEAIEAWEAARGIASASKRGAA